MKKDVFAAAYGYNHSGAFGGKAEYKIYTLMLFFERTAKVEDLTFTIAKKTSKNPGSD